MGTFLSRTSESATLPFTPEQLGEYAEHLGVQQEQLQALLTLFSIRLENIERISILNPYELLEEKPPMVIIGERVLAFHCQNSEQETTEARILTIGTVYNPGFTPEVTTSGLALAQVASTYSESINKKEGVPPMVIRMEYGRIKDEKTSDIGSPCTFAFLYSILFTMAIIATKRVHFTGTFWDYFIKNLGLTVLSVITLGFGIFYQIYWNKKYFFEHMEIEA